MHLLLNRHPFINESITRCVTQLHLFSPVGYYTAAMKRLPFILLFALAAVLFASTALFAQEGGAAPTIVFVDSQAAINAHPAGAEAAALQEQARGEIDALNADLQTLVQKVNGGEQLTAEEQSRFNQLRTALTSVQQRYAEQVQTAAQPAVEAVDGVIQAIADENGYDIILDSVVAGQQPRGINLVVFARDSLDITPQVIERVRAL